MSEEKTQKQADFKPEEQISPEKNTILNDQTKDPNHSDTSKQDEILTTETLNQELEVLKEKYIRLAADMENFRKRSARDIQDTKQFSITGLAKDLLPVCDNLQRALSAVSREDIEKDKNLKTVVDGIEMTQKELISALDRHGIKKITPLGKSFNPHLHQAIFEVETSETPNNCVHEIVQDGYVIGERILRPALVGVSKNKN